MTIPPLQGGGGAVPPFHLPVLTAPVRTGAPPIIGGDPLLWPQGAPPSVPGSQLREDAPISLAGRLELGDVLPDTTRLALALESATRALQSGRAEAVLAELDAVWSHQLAADSPWYLRGGALQLLGRTTDTEQVLRDAVARLPRSAAILYLLGVHTAHRGQFDAARLANDHALSLHPAEPLLWLQRAALAQQNGMHELSTSIMQHAQTLAPAFPAEDWLLMLARLGEARGRTPTPTYQRAVARLTPATMPAVKEQASGSAAIATAPTPLPLPATPLEAAVRYGLTLLESPTQSARTATGATGATGATAADDAMTQLAGMLSGAQGAPPSRVELPSWDAIALGMSLAVLAFVPPLRIPALMIAGASMMLLVSRRMR
jgi:tetratricopeptide (TPR) repeat protein